MKLTKISLATIVALGALSSSAVATPLEEAIKNVDLSGFARYRYDHAKAVEKTSAAKKVENDGNHNFKSVLNLKATYDDNFYGVLSLRYVSSDGSGGKNDTTNTTNAFDVNQFYLGYKAGNTTITAGKQTIGSFFTDDLVGTGIRVSNSDITGLTLTAIAFDAIDYVDLTSAFMDKAGKKAVKDNGGKFTANTDYGNIYGFAAIGSYDPVSFQVWFADITHAVRLAALEVSGDFNVNDDVSVSVKGQFVNAHANKEMKSDKYGNGNFYALEFGSELFGADVTAGYIGWKTNDYKATSFTIDDQASLIDAGEQTSGLNDYTLATGKANIFFLGAGYHVTDSIYAGLDTVFGSVKQSKGAKNTKIVEFVPRASYAYSKKLNFSTFYSYYKDKTGDVKTRKDQIRFEAKYSF